MKKKTKKGESQKKTRNYFSRHKKKAQTRTNKMSKSAQQKKETDKIILKVK